MQKHTQTPNPHATRNTKPVTRNFLLHHHITASLLLLTGIKRVRDACKANSNNIHFNFTDAFWVIIETKVTDKVTDNQKHIISYIEDNPLITTNELAELVGISQRKIKENITKLKKYGIIKRIGTAKEDTGK